MKIAMYWHNGRSLGHTAEVSKISKGIVNSGISDALLGVTGAYNGLDMLPKEMEIVKLPGFKNYDTEEGLLFTNRLGFDRRQLFTLRSQLLELMLCEFQPDVLLVNHEPYGLDKEMEKSIKTLKRTRCILTLRGVIYGAEETNRDYFYGETAKWIDMHYDSIIVNSDPNIFCLQDYYKIPYSISKKIKYVGYLESHSKISKEMARKELGLDIHDKVIVVSMGGGQGTYRIWVEIIKALESLKGIFDKGVFITGPYFEEEDFQKMNNMINSDLNISIIKYTHKMKEWMKSSDVFIGAGGANMLSEVLSVGCNSIIIPRQISESEQQIHATLLSQKGYIRMCTLKDVYEGKIKDVISDALHRPISRDFCDIQMNGAENYYKYLA